VNAALALDATNEGALRALVKLLGDTPEELPPAAERELEDAREAERVRSSRDVVPVVIGLLAFAPFLVWMGVRNVAAVAVLEFVMLGVAAIDVYGARRQKISRRLIRLGIMASFLMFIPMSLLVGSLVLMPAPIVGMTLVTLMSFGRDRGTRMVSLVSGVVAILAPLALEYLGLFPAPYSFADGHMTIASSVVALPQIPTTAFLVAASIASVVLAGQLASRKTEALARAEKRLFAHAWRLRQLIPDEARGATTLGTIRPLDP
jgi:hypothetical protein